MGRVLQLVPIGVPLVCGWRWWLSEVMVLVMRSATSGSRKGLVGWAGALVCPHTLFRST